MAMAMKMTPLERMKALAGITGMEQDALCAMLLDDALVWIVSYTGRTEWLEEIPRLPVELTGIQVMIAVQMYNRRGMEGMAGVSAGGVSRTLDALPQDIQRALNPWRVARVVRMA